MHTCEVRLYSGEWVKGWDKYCVVCGKYFVSFASHGKYCSDKCKREGGSNGKPTVVGEK